MCFHWKSENFSTYPDVQLKAFLTKLFSQLLLSFLKDAEEQNATTDKVLQSTFGCNITDFCDVTSSPPIRKRIGPQPRRCIALKQHQAKVVGEQVEPKKWTINPESSQDSRYGVKRALIDDTDYSFPSENIIRPELDVSKDCATYSLKDCQTDLGPDYKFPSGNIIRPELVPSINVNKRKLIDDSFYFFPSGQIIGLDEPVDCSVKRSKVMDVAEESISTGNLECSLPAQNTVKRKLIDDSYYFFPSGDIIGQVEPTDIGSDPMRNVKPKLTEPKVCSIPTRNVIPRNLTKSTKRSPRNEIKRKPVLKNVQTVPAKRVVVQRQSDFYDNFYNQDLN